MCVCPSEGHFFKCHTCSRDWDKPSSKIRLCFQCTQIGDFKCQWCNTGKMYRMRNYQEPSEFDFDQRQMILHLLRADPSVCKDFLLQGTCNGNKKGQDRCEKKHWINYEKPIKTQKMAKLTKGNREALRPVEVTLPIPVSVKKLAFARGEEIVKSTDDKTLLAQLKEELKENHGDLYSTLMRQWSQPKISDVLVELDAKAKAKDQKRVEKRRHLKKIDRMLKTALLVAPEFVPIPEN